MFKELKKHQLEYLVLVVILILGVVLFLGAWPDRGLQRLISLSISLAYIVWGISTHFKAKRITRGVVLEYVGVGLLAGLLLILITF